jgi:hypothetical protein
LVRAGRLRRYPAADEVVEAEAALDAAAAGLAPPPPPPHAPHAAGVGRCRLTVKKLELKARLVSALETKM